MPLLSDIIKQGQQKLFKGIEAAVNKTAEAGATAVKKTESFLSRVSRDADIQAGADEVAQRFKGKVNLRENPEWTALPIEIREKAFEKMQREQELANIDAGSSLRSFQAGLQRKASETGIPPTIQVRFPEATSISAIPRFTGGDFGREITSDPLKSFRKDITGQSDIGRASRGIITGAKEIGGAILKDFSSAFSKEKIAQDVQDIKFSASAFGKSFAGDLASAGSASLAATDFINSAFKIGDRPENNNLMQDVRLFLDNAAVEFEKSANEDLKKVNDPVVSSVANVGVSSALALTGGLALRAPNLVVGLYSAVRGGDAFKKAKDAGFSDTDALRIAAPAAALEGSLESIGLGKILSNMGRSGTSLFGNVFSSALSEGATEVAQSVAENYISKETYSPETNLLDNVTESFLGGFLGGGAISFLSAVGSRASDAISKNLENKTKRDLSQKLGLSQEDVETTWNGMKNALDKSWDRLKQSLGGNFVNTRGSFNPLFGLGKNKIEDIKSKKNVDKLNTPEQKVISNGNDVEIISPQNNDKRLFSNEISIRNKPLALPSGERLALPDISNKAEIIDLEGNFLVKGKDFTMKTNSLQMLNKKFATPDAQIKRLKSIAKSLAEEDGAKKGFSGDKMIQRLKKEGFSDEAISNITLPDGTKITDVLKVKREDNGVLSAYITKDEINKIRESFRSGGEGSKWVKRWRAENIKNKTQSFVELYEVPQVFFGRHGIKEQIYDPIRNAERVAATKKHEFHERLSGIKLSKKEGVNVGKYYLTRQGKDFGVKLEDLSTNEKKFVEIFDGIIKDLEPDTFATAKINGVDLDKIENYAPLMTREDITIIDEGGDFDYVIRKHPQFGSLYSRKEDVPIGMYEQDYRKVANRFIEKSSEFNSLGKVVPQVKYLIDSKEFGDIVGNDVLVSTKQWLKNITSPKRAATKGGRFIEDSVRAVRKGTARSFLGLNAFTVAKQALSQLPLMIIEKARPKFKSKIAAELGVDTKVLPSILERKGQIGIDDMQEGIDRLFTGAITKADKINAESAISGLLDKELNALIKDGVPISKEVLSEALFNIQDKIDLIFGGMTRAQVPPAFRNEFGKSINMFIGPLTSQLNYFYKNIAEAKGWRKVQKGAEVMAAATAIAYMEQVISNLSFNWGDKEDMAKDILQSLASNIPLLGGIVYAFRSGQQLNTFTPTTNIATFLKELSDYSEIQDKNTKDNIELLLRGSEVFGLPAQIRKTWQGIDVVKNDGIRDRNGKLLAPVVRTEEQIRSLLKGKYGSLASKEYINNIGVSSSQRKWEIPEVEFIQNGDMVRRVQIWNSLAPSDREFLYSNMSQSQRDDLQKWIIADLYPTSTKEELKEIFDQEKNVSSQQYNAHLRKVYKLQASEGDSTIAQEFIKNNDHLTGDLLKIAIRRNYKKGFIDVDDIDQMQSLGFIENAQEVKDFASTKDDEMEDKFGEEMALRAKLDPIPQKPLTQ